MNSELRCTPEVVSWCYRLFLGREPESAWVVEDKLQRLHTLAAICDEFIDSAEFTCSETVERRLALPATPELRAWAIRLVLRIEPTAVGLSDLAQLTSVEQVLYGVRRLARIERDWPPVSMNEPRKAMLLGNCQTDSLRELLRQYTNWQVLNWREDILVDPVEQVRIRQELVQADVVITQQLHINRFGALATSELIKANIRPIVIPNLYFAGLYPELVYLGRQGQRLQSPLGDYHSGLACAAFLAGLTPEEALCCYEDDTLFERAGLFDLWASSWSDYLARELKCDVMMADYLNIGSRSRPLFYSFNHPVGAVMDELARRTIHYVTGEDAVPELMRDDLQNNVIYPVWGPIVRRQKLAYASPAGFYLPVPNGFLPLPDFLMQTYVLYAEGLEGVELPSPVLRLREILSERRSASPGGSPAAPDSSPPSQQRRWWPFGRATGETQKKA
jgi:hypothetical protein